MTPPESTRKRVARPNPHDPLGELKRFIGVCADARKNYSPDALKANVGNAVSGFIDGLDDNSKGLVLEVANIFRRPK
jgi:hypothetical protein